MKKINVFILSFFILLSQCKTQHNRQVDESPKVSENLQNQNNTNMSLITLDAVVKESPKDGDVIVIWDSSVKQKDALNLVKLPELPTITIKNTELTVGDMLRYGNAGKSLHALIKYSTLPIDLITHTSSHSIFSDRAIAAVSMEEKVIRKGMQAHSNFQTSLSGHPLFGSRNPVESSEQHIKDVYEISALSLGETHLPNPKKQIQLFRSNNSGLLPPSDPGVIASVNNLSTIGVQHVLDHEGKRIGSFSATWRSYMSSFGDVATIRNADGNIVGFIEISDKHTIQYYKAVNGQKDSKPFAYTIYNEGKQTTVFEESLPESIDARMMMTAPNSLNMWFGGMFGSL